ncbi:hypothetical protein [Streptomyces sp. NPDC059611]
MEDQRNTAGTGQAGPAPARVFAAPRYAEPYAGVCDTDGGE